ncbi:MAG: prepilin-type N-terminal cleavage/methylation domain-containing protein [Desulfotomaculum sp.]|nr:prepilin-type N-terminal cleavage/methylation domain-containing protein [Desulfotomaculum sp.]
MNIRGLAKFNCRGYTLLELVMVLSILGVFISIALPGYLGYFNRGQLETAAQQLASDIRYIQQRALAEESPTSYGIAFYPAHDKYNVYKSMQILKSVKLPKGLVLQGTTFPEHRMEINQKGIPRSGGGTVSIYNKYCRVYKYVVVASVTGRVRVSDTKPAYKWGSLQ